MDSYKMRWTKSVVIHNAAPYYSPSSPSLATQTIQFRLLLLDFFTLVPLPLTGSLIFWVIDFRKKNQSMMANNRNRQFKLFLLVVFTDLKSEATQLCYSCAGFDADNKTEFFTEFVSQINNMGKLPGSIQDQCLASPSNTLSCDSFCLTVVATVNVKNLASFDMGSQNDSYVMENIRAMGTVRMVIRECLDNLLNSTLNSTDIDPNTISDMIGVIDIGGENVCIDGQLQTSGANAQAAVCFCQTDRCNSNPPIQTVAAGNIPAPIIDSSYTAVCPAPQLNYTSVVPNVCTKNCTTDSDCSATQQKCCNVGGCDYFCANPVYNKPFIGGNCSQMDFTSQILHDLYNNFTRSPQNFSNIHQNLPPLSNNCFNQPITPTKTCQTLAYAFGLLTDFTGVNEQSMQQFDYLQALLENATSSTFNGPFFSQLGKLSGVMRGCAEDISASAFSNGFPKLGAMSGCAQMNDSLFGVGIEAQFCMCNTDECNLQRVAPQLTNPIVSIPQYTTTIGSKTTMKSITPPTTRIPLKSAPTTKKSAAKPNNPSNQNQNQKKAGDRPNSMKATVILMLPVLLFFVFCS